MARQLLIDTLPITLKLEESADGSTRLRVVGEFAKVGVATENHRLYPLTLYEREIKRLESNLNKRRVFGELDHPADGKTKLSRVSHIITSLSLNENGIVVGEAEPIPGKVAGDDLIAMLRAGAELGVSSRGYGSTKPNSMGEDVVQDDYRLVTFDFVADPADGDARPSPVWESKMELPELTLNELEAANPELFEEIKQLGRAEVESAIALELVPVVEGVRALRESKINEAADARAQLRDLNEALKAIKENELPLQQEAAIETAKSALRSEFEEMLVSQVAAAQEDIRKKVQESYENDPAVAGSKQALASIVAVLKPFGLNEDTQSVLTAGQVALSEAQELIADKDRQLQEANSNLERMSYAAQLAGYNFRLEKALSGNVDADGIRTRIGDVTLYESVDQLDAAIESLKTEFEGHRAAIEDARRIGEAKAQAAEEYAAQLKEENEALRNTLKETAGLSKDLALSSYVESRLRAHPKAAELRRFIESRNPGSKDAVDDIIESFRDKPMSANAVEEARARVRNSGVGSGVQRLTEDVPRKGAGFGNDPLACLGTSMEEVRQISGCNGG